MLDYFPKYFSTRAISLYVLLILATHIIFFGYGLPVIPMLFGFTQVFIFFYFTYFFSFKWRKYNPKVFEKRLFWIGLVIRILYIIGSYYFYLAVNGDPFEFESADSKGYHYAAIWYVNSFEKGLLFSYISNLSSVSDQGYTFILAFIYWLFGDNIFIARVVNALFGAITSIFIFRLARRNFGYSVGRLAGIMSMLLPAFIYYSGFHLKEVIMVFFTVVFTERADKVIRSSNLNVKSILLVLILGVVLFFFRTVLGAAALLSFGVASLLTKFQYHTKSNRIKLFIIVIIFVSVISGGKIVVELNRYWEQRTTNQKIGIQSRHRYSKTTMVKYATASVFIPIIIVAPFPAMVNIPSQQNFMFANGSYYARNFYAFFVLIAIFLLWKNKKYRQSILILAFLLSYLAILALSTFALSERFHMPAQPFLLILAAYGICNGTRANIKYLGLYMVFLFLIIIAWNYIKLSSRGLL